MKTKHFVSALALCAGTMAASALAQNINIDYGNLQGTPADGYGAAEGTPGKWNDVADVPGVPQSLFDRDGNPTTVTITDTIGTGTFSFLNPSMTDPDDIALLCDYVDTSGNVNDFIVSGLTPGKYTVYTYAWAPDSAAFVSGVSVNGSPIVSVGGDWPGSLQEGVIYAKHEVDVVGDLIITISPVATFGTLGGIQIVQSGPPLLKLSLANPIPATVFPGSAPSFDAKIDPGTETLVGTPQFCYRLNGGSFTCVNAVNQGGMIWRGTLPVVQCGNTPEFYFKAVGSISGTKNLPVGAPNNFFKTTVASGTTPGTLLDQGFNSGLPAGWTATSLWHVTSSCNSAASCNGGTFAYFGDDATCTYLEGVASTGSLTSPSFYVAPTGNASLAFCYKYEGEGGAPYDLAAVIVNGEQIWSATAAPNWTPVTLSLSDFAGQNVNVEFFFDTVDGLFNDTLGFQVDGVKVTGDVLSCDGSCYPDCDGTGSLDIDDFICFQTLFAIGDPYADCDASGVLDIDDFICFQTFFAIGC